MRLHDLEITAFGPFVDTVRVDFDELAAGGLFLLTGDTGAGKTSVLDAVCFALYGEVPGDRHTAKHLRCDQADPDAAPLVVLRLDVAGRTFRFSRSPAWERPKRRGHGTVRVQAHVVVEELRDGGWTALTTRLDEAGHLVTDLLGMTVTQFTQVAMLPQGRFQAFLRATSAERQAVLQRLFRTRRFEDVERWLVERRVQLHRRSQRFHEQTAAVVSRLQEASGETLPDDWPETLDAVADDGRLAAWAEGLHATALADVCAQGVALVAATCLVADRQQALDRARVHAQSRRRGLVARRQLAELEESLEEERALAASLDAHRRAGPVLPMALGEENAAAAARDAESIAVGHARRAAAQLGVPEDLVDAGLLARESARAGESRAVAESWLPREHELTRERVRRRELATDVATLGARSTTGRARAEELAATRASLAAALGADETLAQRHAADRHAVEVATLGLGAAVEAEQLAVRLEEATALLATTTAAAQDLREAYQDLRERRISGMAAELAGTLAVGCSCPVCGSAEHPSPAVASSAVSRVDEEHARTAYESADFERQAVRESVTALTAQHTSALSRSGRTPVATWETSLLTAETSLAESAEAVRSVEAARSRLSTLDDRLSSARASTAALEVQLDERRREHDETDARVERLEAELEELLGGSTPSVAALVERLEESVTVLDAAREALAVRDRALRDLHLATTAAGAAAREAGFASVTDAVGAVLPGHEAGARAARLEERTTSRTAATAALADPEVVEALAGPEPDVTALGESVEAAQHDRDQVHATHRREELRVSRLGALRADLAVVLDEWAPLRHEHAVTAGLAALVEGRSADNRWRMRLSAYVLSERLRQVVAAANERLGTMTDQRYTLTQVDEKGAGEQRGGLSLRVRDEWSGRERDPATLSGGETFLVSLALALGLADTVTHESGGTQLDTLFVDEGFGALDATTLDGVMDTLDALRDGGRVVGLVSHVAELRDRVTTRLEVRKARRGSTLSPVIVGD